MKTIRRWTATRSGAAITITGDDDQGSLVKLTAVKAISADSVWPIAIDEQGDQWRLLPANFNEIRDAITDLIDPAEELVQFLGEDEGEAESA